MPPIDAATTTAPVDPFVDFAYTGTVTTGNQTLAIIENKKTKEGQFLHVGDSFMGYRIDRIELASLNLSLGGQKKMLAKNDDYKLTPLDKDAANTAPTAARAQGGPNAGGGGMRAMMQNMTPEQRQQMRQQFMSRFGGGGTNGDSNNGGRRGNRGGGGFGGGPGGGVPGGN